MEVNNVSENVVFQWLRLEQITTATPKYVVIDRNQIEKVCLTEQKDESANISTSDHIAIIS